MDSADPRSAVKPLVECRFPHDLSVAEPKQAPPPDCFLLFRVFQQPAGAFSDYADDVLPLIPAQSGNPDHKECYRSAESGSRLRGNERIGERPIQPYRFML